MAKKKQVPVPQEGDCYECQECEMALEITTGCSCDDGNQVYFRCCGKDMVLCCDADTDGESDECQKPGDG